MAKENLLKRYSILSYFISIVGGFFIGLAIAAITEAGKNQMLAAGAIIFFHAIIGAFIAFCLSFFIVFKFNRSVVIGMNVFYALAIVATVFLLRYNKLKRDKEHEQNKQEFRENNNPTPTSKSIAFAIDKSNKDVNQTGLGMFKPDFYNKKTLYFYGDITEGKSIQDHTPIDSVTFIQVEVRGMEMATAPPWLVPEHLKLDYDILLFRAQTILDDFIEVTVNRFNQQTAYVDKHAGQLLYWPEFFMGVSSVELNNPSQTIHVRPFEYSGTVNKGYSFMKPIKIKQQWMYVDLVTDDYESVGKGWIQWQKNGELQITYNLLS